MELQLPHATQRGFPLCYSFLLAGLMYFTQCFVTLFNVCLYFTDSITPTVELNALCMKLGRKPTYKPLDPYTGIRSSYSYNMRGGGYSPRYVLTGSSLYVLADC